MDFRWNDEEFCSNGCSNGLINGKLQINGKFEDALPPILFSQQQAR
jgi:hypothetical protein